MGWLEEFDIGFDSMRFKLHNSIECSLAIECTMIFVWFIIFVFQCKKTKSLDSSTSVHTRLIFKLVFQQSIPSMAPCINHRHFENVKSKLWFGHKSQSAKEYNYSNSRGKQFDSLSFYVTHLSFNLVLLSTWILFCRFICLFTSAVSASFLCLPFYCSWMFIVLVTSFWRISVFFLPSCYFA